jgi:hypothetical protein
MVFVGSEEQPGGKTPLTIYDCAVLLPASDRATKTAANFVFNIAQAHRGLGSRASPRSRATGATCA